MIAVRCPNCKYEFQAPDVLRCPYCKKDLRDATEELSAKHVRRCASYMNPRQYSDRGPGRPSNRERREFFERLIE